MYIIIVLKYVTQLIITSTMEKIIRIGRLKTVNETLISRYFSGDYFATCPPCNCCQKNHAQINTQLNLWKRGAFNKLVEDSHAAPTGCLRRACRNQNLEERHHMFSKRFTWKFGQGCPIFFVNRNRGGGGC